METHVLLLDPKIIVSRSFYLLESMNSPHFRQCLTHTNFIAHLSPCVPSGGDANEGEKSSSVTGIIGAGPVGGAGPQDTVPFLRLRDN